MDNINIKSNIRDITNIQKLKILIKKELWEHSFGLFKAPIAFIVFSVVSYYVLFFFSRRVGDALNYVSLFLIMAFFMCLMASYFLHCFYDDKKNGSLSFFRSMPYSDSLDLASKLIVGFIIIPVAFYLYYEITWLLQSIVLFHASAAYNLAFSHSINFFLFILGVLYFSPILGYFLFVSTFSKRSPYLLAFAPVLASILYTIFVAHWANFFWKFVFLPMENGIYLIFYNNSYASNPSIANGGVRHIVPRTSLEVFKDTLSMPSFWYCIGAFVIFTALALAIRKKSDV